MTDQFSPASDRDSDLPLKDKTVFFLVAEDWSFCSHRLPMARAARDAGARVVAGVRVANHAEKIKTEGFEVTHIPFDRSGINPVKDWVTLLAIYKAYRKYKPDLVHHVAIKPVLYGSLAAWMTGGTAVVNAMTGLGYLFISNSAKAKILRPIVKGLLKWLNNRPRTRLLLQNQDDQRTFIQDIEVEPSHTRIIRGSGVNIDDYDVTPEPEGTIVATCVARMLKDKGIGELVEAARLLKKYGTDIKIRLVGPTDDNPASFSQKELDQWHEEGIVEVAGPSSDIAGEYAKAHIAVLPSYREGLPKSLLEGAACGRALVATDVPGCREICVDGKTGILVPVHSVEPLADALQLLTEKPDIRQRLAKAAREAVETQFADTIIQRQITELYKALISR